MQNLSFFGADVTAAGIVDFKQALPNVKIRFDETQ
jgi:hypothetical protein